MYKLLFALALVAVVLGDFGDDIRALDKRVKCKELWEPCSGFPSRCCNDLQCYWEKGYSALKDGYCVTCVDRGQKCQRDSQCCQNLVCQKGGWHHVDGICDVRRPNGARCHEDDNCASDHCHKKFLHVYGSCKDAHK